MRNQEVWSLFSHKFKNPFGKKSSMLPHPAVLLMLMLIYFAQAIFGGENSVDFMKY